MGFQKDIQQIIEIIKQKVLYFEEIQQVLVSATISERMEKLQLQLSNGSKEDFVSVSLDQILNEEGGEAKKSVP